MSGLGIVAAVVCFQETGYVGQGSFMALAPSADAVPGSDSLRPGTLYRKTLLYFHYRINEY